MACSFLVQFLIFLTMAGCWGWLMVNANLIDSEAYDFCTQNLVNPDPESECKDMENYYD